MDVCVPHQSSSARACVRAGNCAESAYVPCRRELDAGAALAWAHPRSGSVALAAVCTPRCTDTREMAAMRDGLVTILPVDPIDYDDWNRSNSSSSGDAQDDFCPYSGQQTCRMRCF